MEIISDATIKKYSQTAGKRTEIDEILAFTLIVQRIFGQQVLDPDWTWRRYIPTQIFTISLLFYVILGTFEVMRNVNEIKLLAEACYTIIIAFTVPVKYLLFVNNRYTFRKLYITAKTAFYNLIKDDSEERKVELVKKLKIIVKILYSTVLIPVAMYVITAMYFYSIGKRVTLSKTTSILMPMTSPYYEIGLILHTIFLFEMATTTLIIDMWFVFLMFFYCAASDSLEKMLVLDKEIGESEDLYAIRLNDTLRRFYKAHEIQMEYLNVLNDMYRWPTMVPLCKGLLCICLLLLLLSKEMDWSFSSNLLPTVAEIFACNWFGEQIKIKASNLNMALLHFDWTRMRLKDKQNYFVMVSYLKKEFGIKTAFGNDLSLFTMSAVFKASYQAFAVLQTMEN